MMHWVQESEEGVILRLHVQPGAKRTAIAGMHGDAVKLRLAAPAVDGKANRALIAFLAMAFDVPGSQVEIIGGETSRSKRVRVRSPRKRPDRDWAER